MCIKNQGVQCLSIMYLLYAGLARHSFDADDGDVHGLRLELVDSSEIEALIDATQISQVEDVVELQRSTRELLQAGVVELESGLSDGVDCGLNVARHMYCICALTVGPSCGTRTVYVATHFTFCANA